MELINPATAITIPISAKRRIGDKAPKHTYRARTGPNCCTGNCSKQPPPPTSARAVRYSVRYQRKYGI